MKNLFAKIGEEIEVKPIEENIKECKETLKSDVIDRMIDSLEDYLSKVMNGEKGRYNYYIQGDVRTILDAYKEFVELVYSNGNNVGVRKSTNSLDAGSFRYAFDSNYDKLLYYCYLMALKDEYESKEEKDEKETKPKTRVIVQDKIKSIPHHSNR